MDSLPLQLLDALGLLTRGGYRPYLIVPAYSQTLGGVGEFVVWFRTRYLDVPVRVHELKPGSLARAFPRQAAQVTSEPVASIPLTVEALQQHYGGRVQPLSYDEGMRRMRNSRVVTVVRREVGQVKDAFVWLERMLTADVVEMPEEYVAL